MSEHTKGEWEIMPYTRRDGNNIRWVKAVRGRRHISICQTFAPYAEANARLIAAAPELLTACTNFVKGWPHFCDRVDFAHSGLDAEAIRWMNEVPGEIEAAIAKASVE